MAVALIVDGTAVEVDDDGASLLEVLRDRVGKRSVKDGCSPQGQCGCCTVLVDGAPRVACVTPARRVAGRHITTLDGLDPARRQRLLDAFVGAGASQCGYCTPGIIVRLAALGDGPSASQVTSALLAHLCRCTGWQTIVEAAVNPPAATVARDWDAAARRAALEGGSAQTVGATVAAGQGGFADDGAPADALVAVPTAGGGWSVAPTLSQAQTAASKVQGRRSGGIPPHPLELPSGDWSAVLRTTWVEPAYVEPDASWCVPGGEPASPLGNGGAFGGKLASVAPAAARRLADEHGRPVRVLLSREDVVRLGPKRPPVAGGIRTDGTGVLRVARTPGIADAVRRSYPALEVQEVDVAGPPTSAALRAAGWAEATVLTCAASALRSGAVRRPVSLASVSSAASPVSAASSAASSAALSRVSAASSESASSESAASVSPTSSALPAANGGGFEADSVVISPEGAVAEATVAVDGAGVPVHVRVGLRCGEPLDEIVLRSFVIGAAHMALGWVCSEGIAVDDGGTPQDLTIRSFGVLRARDMPPVEVVLSDGTGDGQGAPIAGSDAVFAAVAAACWLAQGLPPEWPTLRGRLGS